MGVGSQIFMDALSGMIDDLGLGKASPLVVDGQGAVEAVMQLDGAPGIAPPRSAGRDINAVGTKANGVVIGDGAPVLEAKQLVEPPPIGRRQPGWGGIMRGDPK